MGGNVENKKKKKEGEKKKEGRKTKPNKTGIYFLDTEAVLSGEDDGGDDDEMNKSLDSEDSLNDFIVKDNTETVEKMNRKSTKNPFFYPNPYL